jgi:hypothetical protein
MGLRTSRCICIGRVVLCPVSRLYFGLLPQILIIDGSLTCMRGEAWSAVPLQHTYLQQPRTCFLLSFSTTPQYFDNRPSKLG